MVRGNSEIGGSDGVFKDNGTQAPKLILADFQAPLDRAPVDNAPQSQAPPPAKQWRHKYGVDGFVQGTPVDNGQRWTPTAQAPDNAPKPGEAAPPPDKGNSSFAPVVADTPPPVNPNQNGADTGESSWTRPGSNPGDQKPMQVAKAQPVDANTFWKQVGDRQKAMETKLDLTTYEPDKAMAIYGGIAGIAGQLTGKFLNARADSILNKKVLADADVPAGEKPPAPNLRQQWARNWNENYNPVDRTRLVFSKLLEENDKKEIELNKRIRTAEARSKDYSDVINGGKPTVELEQRVAEINAGRVADGKPALSLKNDPQELGQILGNDHDAAELAKSKFLRDVKAEGETRTKMIGRAVDASMEYGLAGAARGAGMVGVGILADNLAERWLHGKSQDTGLSTWTGAASIPLALALKPSQLFDHPGKGTAATIDMAAVVGSTVGIAYGADYLSHKLDLKLPHGVSAMYAPNGVDMISMGFAGGFPTGGAGLAGLASRGKFGLSGWLEGRSFAATDPVEKVAFGVAGAIPVVGLPVLDKLIPSLEHVGMPKGGRGVAVGMLGLEVAASVWSGMAGKPDLSGDSSRAWDAFRDDAKSKSGDSMQTATDKFSKFADDNKADTVGPLYSSWLEWNNPTKSFPPRDEGGELERFRGNVILSTAMGESQLKLGTTLGYSKELHPTNLTAAKDGDEISLKGLNLDIGGEATKYLESASENVTKAINETKYLAGKNNQPVDQSQIDGLTKMQTRIDADLHKIYNEEHDVPGAIDTIAQFRTQNAGQHLQYTEDRINRMKELAQKPGFEQSPRLQRMVAKMARDVAMLYMGQAESLATHNDGNGAQGTLATAKQYIDLSKHYAGDNPDLPRMDQALADLNRLASGQARVDDAHPWNHMFQGQDR